MSDRIFNTVEEYCEFCGGNRPIKKVLIANNGNAAIKAIRSIRRWAYQTFADERKISFVVMATKEDMNANAEYIRMADEIVDVPGGPNNNNYANVMLIVELALRYQVDAVWAGWGHASEKDLLPDTLAKTPNKIVFIGPAGAPMRALGDKIGSTIIAQSAGVSCIGWNGDKLRCDYKTEGGIPQEVYDQANVTSEEMCMTECARVGFPIMIKASEGGGGKGVRKVTCEAEVATAFRQVQGEVPGSPIFVMKLAPRARHLEVQLLADQHGNAIALNGRDCSVQRRFQKIIEEGPPIAAKPEIWPQMEKAAVALAQEVNYSNAGTVEYLYCFDDDTFAFLELNPRLQVEHPVTEMITGVNLPAAQLQVSMGIPLQGNPEIRRLYGYEPYSKEHIDFEGGSSDHPKRIPPKGHCIAVRITAENPDAGFQPTSGTIEELNFRSTPDVWGYFSVDSSGTVHEFADSQFGHLFAHGENRESARKNMIMALKELSIRGDIRTTTEYIIQMMTSPDFIENHISTAWLDERIKLGRNTPEAKLTRSEAPLVATVGALVTFVRKISGIYDDFVTMIKRGQSPAHDMIVVEDTVSLIYEDMKYVLQISQAGGESDSTIPVGTHGIFYLRAVSPSGQISADYVEARVHMLSDKGYLIHVGGRSHTAYATHEPTGLRLTLDGQTCVFSKEYDPTRLTTDVAGKLVKQLVSDGDHVEAGQAFAEIEVMKMFMPVKAHESGTLLWQLTEGAAMVAGDLMATMDLDHPELVKTAAKFEGSLTECAELRSTVDECKAKALDLYPHRNFTAAYSKLETIMKGYAVPDEQYEKALEDLGQALQDPLLVVYDVADALGPLSGRLDVKCHKDLMRLVNEALDGQTPAGEAAPFAERVLARLADHTQGLTPDVAAAFRAQCAALYDAAERFKGGVAARSIAVLQTLVALYMRCEREFNNVDKPKPFNEAVKDLRKDVFPNKPEAVFETCRSHRSFKQKNDLMCFVLQQIRDSLELRGRELGPPSPPTFSPGGTPSLRKSASITKLMRAASDQKVDATSLIKADLSELSAWTSKAYNRVALEARMLLIEQEQPSIAARRSRVAEWLRACLALSPGIEKVDNGPRARKMAEFLHLNIPLHDLVADFLTMGDEATQFAALELYIRKIYPLHNLRNLEASGGETNSGGLPLTLKFQFFNTFTDAAGLSTSTSVADLASSGASATLPGGKALRTGVFVKCASLEEFAAAVPALLAQFPAAQPGERVDNCLHVALLGGGAGVVGQCASASLDEDAFAGAAAAFLQGLAPKLSAAGLARVTVLTFVGSSGQEGGIPSIFTFRNGGRVKAFAEDKLFRNIEPSYAYHLDILRLANFDISLCYSHRSQAGNVQVYKGPPTAGAAKVAGASVKHARFFVRSVSINQTDDVPAEASRMLVEALKALNTATSEHEEKAASSSAPEPREPGGPGSSNHIFLNVVANNASPAPALLQASVVGLMKRYRRQVSALGVAHVEVRSVPTEGGNPLRLLASDPTGTGIIVVEAYEEVAKSGESTGEGAARRVLRSVSRDKPGIWEGALTTSPYEVYRKFEKERAAALASSDTLFCYDYIDLFRESVALAWAAKEDALGSSHGPGGRRGARLARPAEVLDSVELVVKPRGAPLPIKKADAAPWNLKMAEEGQCELVECQRPMGQNDVGMAAWLLTLRTPEYPAGRLVVLISNDITYVQGSFGTREDWVFKCASEYARARGLPRLYLAANSGARIGMANKLKAAFKVEWNNPTEPGQGYKYLYLSPEDNVRFIADGSVKTQLVLTPENEARYMITDVVGDFHGSEPDLGVENLRGSGMIAGETSRAYEEIFTLTVVTGRSVGIGAYLVRLGQRTIQKTEKAPIILTGYQALNKLMGKEIYTSNDQLGGGGLIMYPNGVSHMLADDHLDAINKTVRWLSYVPARRRAPLPITDMKGVDSVERLVEFEPSRNAAAPFDNPRYLVDGIGAGDTSAPLGFFDRGSFTETLNEWAQTVVVGRARLGGIPMGVIVTENRTRISLTPADPADPNTSEVEVMQAGGVWFPDSAYKTAQALKDFKGEDLPVMIFANWRGFSGGQRDMFLEVLKFGAMIVDALVASEQPIFVYIPPYAELRGGAWVVVDSTINPSCMEFFAAENSRGGVLEATGAASIKYREKDILTTMRRVDSELLKLAADTAKAKEAGDEAAQAACAKAMKQREKKIMPIYQQIAVQFADLHDTPGRMEATGVVSAQVEWKSSRSYFYWRLRRRLAEFQIRRQIAKFDPSLSPTQCSDLIRKWFIAEGQPAEAWADSRKVLAWIGDHQAFLRVQIETMRADSVAAKTTALALECPEGAAAGVVAAFQQMDAMQREVLRQQLASIH